MEEFLAWHIQRTLPLSYLNMTHCFNKIVPSRLVHHSLSQEMHKNMFLMQRHVLQTWALSTDLPEHLSSRKKPYVGGHWQRKAISQPVELRWGRACGNTFHVDWTVQDRGQLLDRVAVAIYHRRDWRARLKQTLHAFFKDRWLFLTEMDNSPGLEINQQTHRKHSDWISCPLLLQGWLPHRCTCQYHWFELLSLWACCHLDWSWAKVELYHNIILTLDCPLQRHLNIFFVASITLALCYWYCWWLFHPSTTAVLDLGFLRLDRPTGCFHSAGLPFHWAGLIQRYWEGLTKNYWSWSYEHSDKPSSGKHLYLYIYYTYIIQAWQDKNVITFFIEPSLQ